MQAQISCAAVTERLAIVDSDRYGLTLRGSASQSGRHTPKPEEPPQSINLGVQGAAAVDSLLTSVRLEIEEDLTDLLEPYSLRSGDTCKSLAIEIARKMALRFYKQPWVDIAGFVANDGRIAVLAHSMETGRRITFYVDHEAKIQAIRTSVSEEPVWSAAGIQEVPLLVDWIVHID